MRLDLGGWAISLRNLFCIVMVKFIETIQPSIETINKLNVDLRC